ncbi:hypothetical protein N7535_005801 [Penicillium sp. DV-2018c]|nr:hypothetical protein N7461_009376 [Penicillium sp. DV-2018c]KAJ5572141.1 hypothetical protein N7535_005801 [Penicillium sp. DV-2018c]
MTSKQLPLDAEILRRQIKSMISEVQENEQAAPQSVIAIDTDSEGNKEYTGEALSRMVSALVRELPIGLIGLGVDSGIFCKSSNNQK